MSAERSLGKLARRVIGALLVLSFVAAGLIYIFRRPLLLDEIRATITRGLATALDATVACSHISGDPIERVVLHDLSIQSPSHGLDVRRAELALELDAFALTAENGIEAIESARLRAEEIRIVEADLAKPSGARDPGESSADADRSHEAVAWSEVLASLRGGLDIEVRALHVPGLPDPVAATVSWRAIDEGGERIGRLTLGENNIDLRADADGLAVEARDFALGQLAFERGGALLHRAKIGASMVTTEAAGRVHARGLRWRSLRVENFAGEASWHNAELALRELEFEGVREANAHVACSATGKIRLDLPRGRARRVTRVHWNLVGAASPSAFGSIAKYWPSTRASAFRSHGSAKLPISRGDEEEYLAGSMMIEMPSIQAEGFDAPLHLRCRADIDGMGLLIFRRCWLRSGERECVAVRGRYPLHVYGRPDLRINIDIDDVRPWIARAAQSLPQVAALDLAGTLRGELKLRGPKSAPRIKLRLDSARPHAGPILDVLAPTHETPPGWEHARHKARRAPLHLQVEASGTLADPELRLEARGHGLRAFALGRSPHGIAPGTSWDDPLFSLRENARGLQLLADFAIHDRCSVAFSASLGRDGPTIHRCIPVRKH